MLSKAEIKLIRSLQLKKHRVEEGLFVAEGKKMVEELLKSPIEITQVYVCNDYQDMDDILLDLQDEKKYDLLEVSREELEKISSLTTPQGILALCKIPAEGQVLPDFAKELVLVLDDIRDPGNMGTILRIADWFGIRHIYCSAESVDVYNPKVIQASMGSIVKLQVHYTDLITMLNEAGEGIPVYGAVLNGKSIYEENLRPNGLLVIGNESTGISEDVFKFITKPISIPIYNTNGPESLNAGVATAILCAEFRRIAK
ncbi:MAG TPA: RNA methyltransferase [Bacteroidia bacterium]|nr:RNA methyltransferase [Bacteroidia bacterium]